MSQLIHCPECKKHLQVPDELIGKSVQCPECKHAFTAMESTPTEVVATTSRTASRPPPPPSNAPKRAEWDRHDDEAEEESSRAKPPSKRRTRHDDDDDDDDGDIDDQIRRRRRRRSRYGADYGPHRGGMILAFGIISIVSFAVFAPLALVFGPLAWFMGNADMAEIRAGRMDPSGESMVQTGRIIGIVSTLLCGLALVAFGGCCCLGLLGPIMQGPRG